MCVLVHVTGLVVLQHIAALCIFIVHCKILYSYHRQSCKLYCTYINVLHGCIQKAIC